MNSEQLSFVPTKKAPTSGSVASSQVNTQDDPQSVATKPASFLDTLGAFFNSVGRAYTEPGSGTEGTDGTGPAGTADTNSNRAPPASVDTAARELPSTYKRY
jgi:hypothetical protein